MTDGEARSISQRGGRDDFQVGDFIGFYISSGKLDSHPVVGNKAHTLSGGY